jgi:hypothetical protein
MSNINKTTEMTLGELLSLYDQDFIYCAYKAILGREPDPEGLSYYIARIQSGISKEEILTQLRISAEGRSRNVNIAGLDKLIKSHRRLKTPFIGMFLRHMGPKKRERNIQQKLSAIENKLYAQGETLLKLYTEINTPPDKLKNMIQRSNAVTVNTVESDKTNQSSHFDAAWYLEQYPDVSISGTDSKHEKTSHKIKRNLWRISHIKTKPKKK